MTNVVALSFVALQVVCGDLSGWRLAEGVRALEPGVEEVTLRLACEKPQPPPHVRVEWAIPQLDTSHYWEPGWYDSGISPDWSGGAHSMIASCAPVYSLYSDSDENRLAVAADDAVRPVGFKAGLCEEDRCIHCSWEFFAGKPRPSTNETLRLRFDTRRTFWSDAVRDAAAWVSATPGYEPLTPPPDAFRPLYSTWYAFHQDVRAGDIEDECALAASLGMGTLIVDDGWQTDDTHRGYDFCGDWEVSRNRFPDMAAHVKRVHALGMKYMVWCSVPLVGVNSRACARFKGKFLREPRKGEAGVLDPRFPEVREHLAGVFEKALREWDLDGFKLDFIDSFSSDPGVPEAVDMLMTDIVRRLRAIRPGVLIEFRQSYIGPAIRRYGNMFRAADCPGDMARNRREIARLRLTSGSTAVHSDMLEWHSSDTPENAARFILNSIFGTVQYSMALRTLPPDHLRMMRHWIGFSRRHERALLHGEFRPHWPHQGYSLLVGESDAERIIGVYNPDLAVDAGAADRTVLVLNATQGERLALRLAGPCEILAFDTFGRETGARRIAQGGLVEAKCPPSGYLEVRFREWPEASPGPRRSRRRRE